MKHKEIIFLFVLTILFFTKAIINYDEIISSKDSDLIHIGLMSKGLIVNTILQYGELPLWNPCIFSGTPFLSNPQSAMFYPFTYLFVVFQSSFTWTLVLIIDVFLMGTFTYLFARKINLSKHSSIISAVTYMFAGTVSTRIYAGHSMLIDAMVWFPLIILLYEIAITEKKAIYGIYTGFTLAIMFFTGHVQFVTYGVLIASLYYLLRTLYEDKKHYAHLTLIFLLSLIVLFSLISIQLLPALEFAHNVDRCGGISFTDSSTYSITPLWLITFIVPEFFGSPINSTFWHYGNMWELCGYVGILPLILSFVAISRSKNMHRSIFITLAIFTLLFALGKYTPVYSIFFNYIPTFDLFRAPARILFIYTFCIAILAGIGCDNLHKVKNLAKTLSILSITSIIAIISSIIIKPYIISLGHYIVDSKYTSHPYLNAQPITYWYDFAYEIFSTILHSSIIFTVILITITGIFIIKPHITPHTFKRLLILIIILDLFTFAMPYIVTNPMPNTPDYMGIINTDYRTMGENALPQHMASSNNIELVNGYDANYVTIYQDFLYLSSNTSYTKHEITFSVPKFNNLNMLKLLNTKYIVTPEPIFTPGLTTIYNQNDTIIYSINDTLPRSYIIRNATVIHDRKTIFTEIQSMNITSTVVLEEDPLIPLINKGHYEHATVTLNSPNKVTINTNLTSPGFLVLSSTYYPGWNAYDNGNLTPIFKTNYILKSVYLLPGEHEVIFIYEPQSYKIGKHISVFSLIIFTLLILLYRRSC